MLDLHCKYIKLGIKMAMGRPAFEADIEAFQRAEINEGQCAALERLIASLLNQQAYDEADSLYGEEDIDLGLTAEALLEQQQKFFAENGDKLIDLLRNDALTAEQLSIVLCALHHMPPTAGEYEAPLQALIETALPLILATQAHNVLAITTYMHAITALMQQHAVPLNTEIYLISSEGSRKQLGQLITSPQPFLQLINLIPNGSSFLKFQILGMHAHLFLQLFDRLR